jgi:hypothetical protein
LVLVGRDLTGQQEGESIGKFVAIGVQGRLRLLAMPQVVHSSDKEDKIGALGVLELLS